MAKAPIEIKSLARAHTERAIQTLQGIMDASDAPHSARVTAAIALLDRGWGKPETKGELTVTRRISELTDSEIASRIAELRGAEAFNGDTVAPVDPSQLN